MATGMPKITIYHPDGEETTYELSTGLISIGRGPDNNIVLPEGSCSGNHAILKQGSAGDYSVTDLGSTNHTQVNGKRVQTFDLLDGDVILFGDIRVSYESEISVGKGGSKRAGIAPPPPSAPNRKLSAPPSFSAEEKRQHGAAKPVKKRRKKVSHPDDGAGAGGCFALLMLPLLLVVCLFAGMEARHYFSTDKRLLHEELLQLYKDVQAEKAAAAESEDAAAE